MKSKSKPDTEAPVAPGFDDVLKRMLSSPPKQHKDERAKPKPKPASSQKKKPAGAG